MMVLTDNTTLPTAQADTSQTFNFFGLAQELRDAIYDQCYEDSERNKPFDNVHLKTRGAIPHLQLINRQFKREYDLRLLEFSQLEIIDNDQDTISMSDLNFPAVLYGTTFLKVDIQVFRCSDGQESEGTMHLDWISKIIDSLYQLRTVHIVVRFQHESAYDQYLELLADDFSQLPKLAKKELVGMSPGWRKEEFALAEWAPAKGLVFDDKELKAWC